MTKLRSTLRLLLPATFFAAALSCGGNPEVTNSTDLTVDQQAVATTYTLSCLPPGTGFGAFALAPGVGGPAFIPLTSLAAVPNPVLDVNLKTGAYALRADLGTYVADLPSAIQLGKALFWDIQAGSDNSVSCATCHFQAGQDVRTKNQLNPGFNGSFDAFAPNYTLTAADFPFTDPALLKDVDNVSGSQGVVSLAFLGISATGAELTGPGPATVFGPNRQVTGMNSPTLVNSVFNHRNFFNGRSQPEFNGVNPWGARDGGARVWQVIDTAGNVGQIDVRIGTASLASQSVGPPLNTVEMSAVGRTFPDLGKKLLLLKPLGLQKVDPRDSVLGGIAEPRAKGLKTTYAALIQKAFQPQWWNSTKTVTVGGKPYTLTQANFSLFWGLSIMLYEATLVADQSPMDQYVASRTIDAITGNVTADNPALLDPVVTRLAAEGTTIPLATGGSRAVTRADILAGLNLFERPVPLPGTTGFPPGTGAGCAFCHVGAETTSASVRNLSVGLEIGAVAFKNAGFDLRMERMFMGVRTPPPTPPQPPPPVPLGSDVITYDNGAYAVNVIDIAGVPVTPRPVPINTYDVGWYDIGVRPVAEDPGIGGVDFAGRPLSWTGWFQTILATPSVIKIPGGGLGCVDANGFPVTPPAGAAGTAFAGEVLDPGTGFPILSGGLSKTEATDVMGSFKTPALRNVELNGPYFHNGGKATLRQAMELYDDGGNFQNPTLSPLIRPLGMTPDQVAGLVAFLVSLTDDRVLYQRAPFDHPELPLPAGKDAAGNDLVTVFPAVGAAGAVTPLPRYLGLNPFQ